MQRGSGAEQSPWSGVREEGKAPLKLKLSFWTCNGKRNFARFLVFGKTKTPHRYLCCLAKMTFNKSHLGITIKIFLGGWRGVGGGKNKGTGATVPPSGAAHGVLAVATVIMYVSCVSCVVARVLVLRLLRTSLHALRWMETPLNV